LYNNIDRLDYKIKNVLYEQNIIRCFNVIYDIRNIGLHIVCKCDYQDKSTLLIYINHYISLRRQIFW